MTTNLMSYPNIYGFVMVIALRRAFGVQSSNPWSKLFAYLFTLMPKGKTCAYQKIEGLIDYSNQTCAWYSWFHPRNVNLYIYIYIYNERERKRVSEWVSEWESEWERVWRERIIVSVWWVTRINVNHMWSPHFSFLSLSLYIYISICFYLHTHVYSYKDTQSQTRVHADTHTHTHIYIYTDIYIYIYIYVSPVSLQL